MSADTATPIEIDTRVICWTSGGASVTPNYAIGKVVKVNRKTFKVVTSSNLDEPLFPIEADARGQRVVRGTGGVWASRRVCTPLASPLGAEMHERARDLVAKTRATHAAREFVRDPDSASALDAAIRELTALRDRRTAAASSGSSTEET
jgi:hypothetical protein